MKHRSVCPRPAARRPAGRGAGWPALAFALAAAATPAWSLAPRAAVEAPPARFTSGPTQYGQTVERTFSRVEDLQAFCNLYLGRPARGYYQACYIPAMDTVVLPNARAWPSRRERSALRAHEWAHARGWRHESLKTASAAQY